MPRSWHVNRSLWLMMAFFSLVAGWYLLRRETPDKPWTSKRRGARFNRVVLYTRRDCHLCHQAKDVLFSFRKWLPPIEEVDVDDDPELAATYGDQIPVVEIDGKVRFRGEVNELLLRRLLSGRAASRTDDDDNQSDDGPTRELQAS
jgi:glutaredoxin